ncbi:hypothetical protein IWW50_000916 [Coemansia erecta]|nr:hypothetical protein GGF43_002944 [Coemansia sp. RSA 2618]KAJ2829325.1 hypothetical protein IWW50_000916 [Coemansia erecta]
MTVEAEREKRANAIEKRLSGGQEVADAEPQDTSAPDAAPAKRTAKRGKFPGSGQSLSGEAEQPSDAGESEDEVDEAELEEADSGSDFEEELTEDEEDAYSDEDAEDDVAPRGGQGTYNLRTAASKRRLSDGADDSDDGEVSSPRTRRRTAVNYSEGAGDHDDDEADEESEDDA